MNTSNKHNSRNHADAHMQNLITLFSQHTQNKEGGARIFFEKESLSFFELDQQANSVARFLMTQNIPAEALVCILMTRSIEAIISKLGILKAGTAYLPMSPEDFPVDRICAIFEEARVSVIVTSKAHETLLQRIHEKLGRKLICYFLDAPNNNDIFKQHPQRDDMQSCQAIKPDRLAYVMYTSGSTGKPKGVMITHRNIISTVKDTRYLKLNEKDALLHAAPISFDAASFEIWAALLNGKDLYIVPETRVHNINAFSDYVRTQPITIAWLTSALCNLITEIRPDFFEHLRLLLVGGEALSPRHINQIRQRYPRLAIRNSYGPTENSIFSTSFLIDKDYQDNIPIGRSLCHKRAYILNENLDPVSGQAKGELFVAGDGLARGYLNRPLETQEKFLPDPFFPGENMYATGDMCRYNQEGEIEFIGRIDKQVKISGHRIELGEIESVLQANPQIKQAIVLYKHLGAEVKGLAAYIHTSDYDPAKLKNYLSEKLPNYMLPSYIEVVESFPLTINGKVDRNAMSTWPIKASCVQIKRSIDDTVMQSCSRILEIESIDPRQSFFALGGDSLLGTSLIIELEQQLDITLPLTALYENPCIADLIQHIQSLTAPKQNTEAAQETRSLAEEAKLSDDIQIAGRQIHHIANLNQAHARIFLTGATGFFGAFVLKELLDSTNATIHCLVRASNPMHARERLLETFKQYKIPVSTQQIARLIGLPGDLCQANLGLSPAEFDGLAQSMDVIMHNGASVNYVDTYATLKGPNVIGTQEVLRLSCHRRIIPVHYISSVSVFETLGFFTGREFIYETDSVDISEHYVRLGYSQSKWVAEKMMENAKSLGLPVNIYRSGYIMGHSQSGVANTTDHIARYIAGCIEMGCAPILEEYASLAPVDQLSKVFCHVALKAHEHGKTYHLCNPTFISVDDIYQKIQAAGFALDLISYTQWKEKLKAAPKSNPLYPLLSLHIHAAENHRLTLPELYERNTRFDCTNLLAALKGSGLQIDLKAPALFERWLEYYLEAGLISEQTFNQAQAMELSA